MGITLNAIQQVRPLEAVLSRDRLVVMAGLAAVIALAWAYTANLAWGMGNMDVGGGMAISVANTRAWSPGDFVAQFAMWIVMMMAMMVPSAAPMVLLFSTVNRRRQEQEKPYVPTSVFLLGYLALWTGFAISATLAQWGLHQAALLSSIMGESSSAILGGSLLLAAGLYQWTPLKYACLSHCLSPLGFLMTEWREGPRGALAMGLKHGTYCVGCCWVLMGLLFVTGVMNLAWVAIIAGFVLLEKLFPKGQLVGRAAGLALIGLAGWTYAGGLS